MVLIRHLRKSLLFCFLVVSLFSVARAQNSTAPNTRSTVQNPAANVTPLNLQENAPSDSLKAVTNALILDPIVRQRLRDDNVLVTQDVQHADAKSLASVARGGAFPVYIVIVRRLPHGFKSAALMAETIRRQLDVSANSLVIVATEADGRLGLSANDIEYSIAHDIAKRSAMVWTQEGYTKGAAQTVRLVAAERETQREAQINRVTWIGVAGLLFLFAICSLWVKRRSRK